MRAEGREHDFQVARTILANERTFLAWVRTGLALVSAGVAVAHLFPGLAVPGGPIVVGVLVIGLGAAGLAIGYLGWKANQQRILNDELPVEGRGPHLMGAAMAVFVILALAIALAAGS